ncbi:hypothetical protein Dimus_012138 [Dionaea muscipula]
MEGSGADRELALVEVPVEERMDEVRDECDLTLNLMAPSSAMSSKQALKGEGGQMMRPSAACDQPVREDLRGKAVMPQGQVLQKVDVQRDRSGKDGVWVVVKGDSRPSQVGRCGDDVGMCSRFQPLHDETLLEIEGTASTRGGEDDRGREGSGVLLVHTRALPAVMVEGREGGMDCGLG